MAEYDLIIIGSGPGGYSAALTAADFGMKAAVVERGQLGGTCLNWGCIPTKTLLRTAKLTRELAQTETIGIRAADFDVDLKSLCRRKDEVAGVVRDGIAARLRDKGVDVIRGQACFIDNTAIRVGEEIFSASHFVVATGLGHRLPGIPGCDLPFVLTPKNALDNFDTPRKKIVIVGGGVMGAEFATIYSSLGSEVHIVELQDRILPAMDSDVSALLASSFRQSGISLHTSARLIDIAEDGDAAICTLQKNSGEERLACDAVLMTGNGAPNIDGLFGPGLSLAMTPEGAIAVDSVCRTSLPNIYAVGDIVNLEHRLASLATAQGENAVCDICGKPPRMNVYAIPHCVYTIPEIACVGLSVEEAGHNGRRVRVSKANISPNPMSLIESSGRGFVKVVVDAETGVLLGAVIVNAKASEMISEFTTAIANKLTAEQLAKTIRPHPSFNESVLEALRRVV